MSPADKAIEDAKEAAAEKEKAEKTEKEENPKDKAADCADAKSGAVPPKKTEA